MRHCICLAALVCASAARAATIVSPGPPAVPADYLEVNLDWLPSDPGYVNGRTIDALFEKVDIIDQHFWLQRAYEGTSPQYEGWIETRYAPAPGRSATVIYLKLQPEIDADLAEIDVLIGESAGGMRPITITATGGYSRTYDSVQIPEPATWALGLLGCCVLRRWRV